MIESDIKDIFRDNGWSEEDIGETLFDINIEKDIFLIESVSFTAKDLDDLKKYAETIGFGMASVEICSHASDDDYTSRVMLVFERKEASQ